MRWGCGSKGLGSMARCGVTEREASGGSDLPGGAVAAHLHGGEEEMGGTRGFV